MKRIKTFVFLAISKQKKLRGLTMKGIVRITAFAIMLVFLSSPVFANWLAETPLNTPRDQFTGGVIDGKIYVFGGNGDPNGINLKSTEMFDPATRLWTYRADNEHNNGNGVEELTGAVVNGKLYVFSEVGGGNSFVEEYDPISNTWTSKAPMPTPRSNAATVVYNGEIYTFGGYRSQIGQPSDVVEAYNPLSNSWRSVATTMPNPIESMGIAVIGDIVYLFGGADNTEYYSDVYTYNFQTNQWGSLTPLKTHTSFSIGGTAAQVIDGKIYLIGGATGTPASPQILGMVMIYDTTTNTWCTGPSLPQPTVHHLTVILNNTIYVIGGIIDLTNNIRTGAVWKLALPINLLGDIDKDCVIDISDVILILRMALKIDPLKPCSDINNDGIVDISDVILTLRMALKIDPLQQCI
jgi:N-acetylneuraminic acid mutarotase